MIKVPEYNEVLEITKGSKASLAFVLYDEDYNEADVSSDTFTCKVVDDTGTEQAGACSIGIDNGKVVLMIDTTNLTAGNKYFCEAEDSTLSLCIARIEIHIKESIIHG